MRVSNNISLKVYGRLVALVTAAFVWHGCLADGNSMVPEAVITDDVPGASGRSPVSFENGGNNLGWYTVAEKTIKPGTPSVFKAGRYKLIFDGDEFSQETVVTVRELDPDVIDVDFLPDGIVLNNPATLEIDCKNTANDPDSPNFNGMPHQVYWFDPQTGWVAFEGNNNTNTKKFTAELNHFSRYAMFDGTGILPATPRYRQTKNDRDDVSQF